MSYSPGPSEIREMAREAEEDSDSGSSDDSGSSGGGGGGGFDDDDDGGSSGSSGGSSSSSSSSSSGGTSSGAAYRENRPDAADRTQETVDEADRDTTGSDPDPMPGPGVVGGTDDSDSSGGGSGADDSSSRRLRDDAESDPMNPQTEPVDVGGGPSSGETSSGAAYRENRPDAADRTQETVDESDTTESDATETDAGDRVGNPPPSGSVAGRSRTRPGGAPSGIEGGSGIDDSPTGPTQSVGVPMSERREGGDTGEGDTGGVETEDSRLGEAAQEAQMELIRNDPRVESASDVTFERTEDGGAVARLTEERQQELREGEERIAELRARQQVEDQLENQIGEVNESDIDVDINRPSSSTEALQRRRQGEPTTQVDVTLSEDIQRTIAGFGQRGAPGPGELPGRTVVRTTQDQPTRRDGDIFSGAVSAVEDTTGIDFTPDGSVVNQYRQSQQDDEAMGLTADLGPVSDAGDAATQLGEQFQLGVVEPVSRALGPAVGEQVSGMLNPATTRGQTRIQTAEGLARGFGFDQAAERLGYQRDQMTGGRGGLFQGAAETVTRLAGQEQEAQQIANVEDPYQISDSTQTRFGEGVVTGGGALANVPALAGTAVDATEYGAQGIASTATGQGGEFVEGSAAAGVTLAATGAEYAASNPTRFAGQVVGSTIASVGVIGGAQAVGGATAGRAASYAVQPGEEVLRAGIRRGITGGRSAFSRATRRSGSGTNANTRTSGTSETSGVFSGIGSRTPDVRVEADPEAGRLEISDDVRQQIREATVERARSGASALRETPRRAREGAASRVRGARQTVDEFDVNEVARQAGRREMELETSVRQGVTRAEVQAEYLGYRGGRFTRQQAERVAGRANEVSSRIAERAPSVRRDIDIRRAAERGGDVARGGVERLRSGVDTVQETGADVALRSPTRSADVGLQRAFTGDQDFPELGARESISSAFRAGRTRARGGVERAGDIGRSVALRSPSPTTGASYQQAFMRGGEVPDPVPDLPSVGLGDAGSTARRELTGLRFGLAERGATARQSLGNLRDFTVRVGESDTSTIFDTGSLDEPTIRSQSDDPFGLVDDTETDLEGGMDAGATRTSGSGTDVRARSGDTGVAVQRVVERPSGEASGDSGSIVDVFRAESSVGSQTESPLEQTITGTGDQQTPAVNDRLAETPALDVSDPYLDTSTELRDLPVEVERADTGLDPLIATGVDTRTDVDTYPTVEVETRTRTRPELDFGFELAGETRLEPMSEATTRRGSGDDQSGGVPGWAQRVERDLVNPFTGE